MASEDREITCRLWYCGFVKEKDAMPKKCAKKTEETRKGMKPGVDGESSR